MSRKIIIMGAAGRDFHVFNLVYRSDPTCTVVGFTATQIPGIEDRATRPDSRGRAIRTAFRSSARRSSNGCVVDGPRTTRGWTTTPMV